jgi:hypothetical protein
VTGKRPLPGAPFTHTSFWGGFEVGETPEERTLVGILRTGAITLQAEVDRLRVELRRHSDDAHFLAWAKKNDVRLTPQQEAVAVDLVAVAYRHGFFFTQPATGTTFVLDAVERYMRDWADEWPHEGISREKFHEWLRSFDEEPPPQANEGRSPAE